jgi:mevalonate kinase
MAKEIIVDFTIKSGTAVREVKNLKKEIQSVNKEAVKTTDKTSKGLKDVEKSSGKAAGGIGKIGTAFKALGIGLIIGAFAKFTEVLNQNQKVLDFFNTTFEALSIIFNDVIGSAINAVSSFDNFKEAVKGIYQKRHRGNSKTNK